MLATSSPVRADTNVSVMVTSLKTSSTSEMVELYNAGEDVDVTGWYLEYSNVSGSNIKKIAELNGLLPLGTYVSYSSATYDQSFTAGTYPLIYSGMADSGGFIRLYKPALGDVPRELVDQVGWLSATELSTDTSILSLPSKSAHRCADGDGNYVKRSNQQDFYITETPITSANGEVCIDLVENAEDDEEVVIVNSCTGLQISELLPNPAGEDNGREFIELYNSLDIIIPIEGCKLAIDDLTYTFANIELPPKSFFVLTNQEAQFNLINSRQGTVYLLGSDATEISQITYPENLADDQSWAQNGTEYTATFEPTPGEQNRILEQLQCEQGYERNPDTNRCNKIVIEVASAQTCSPGYELNTSTGRCRKTSTATSSVCPVGQTRNPLTNRCKTLQKSSNSLTPCKVGEYRNPETNRCKKIDTGSDLLSCPIGQTRNPDTNRCRTESEVEEPINVQDLPAARVSTTRVPVSVIGVGALSYAVYEWKPEIRSLLRRIRKKIIRIAGGK